MPDPNKIEGGRWDRVLRSIFNLKGAGSTAARVAEDISATFNFPYRPEHDYLIGDRLMVGQGNSGPTAGQNSQIILTNDSDNKLIIVERFTLRTDLGGIVSMGATSAPVGFLADIAVFTRDGRWGPLEQDQGAGTSRLQETPFIGFPTPTFEEYDLGTQTGPLSVDATIVLKPNDHFFLFRATVNVNLRATIWWREHLMEPSEVA